jgi:hypothetical protein
MNGDVREEIFAAEALEGFCFGMDVMVHLTSPLQESPQALALSPEKLPEFKEADLRHFDAGVGLDAPEQIGAAPRGNPVAAGGVPEEAQHLSHWNQYSAVGVQGPWNSRNSMSRGGIGVVTPCMLKWWTDSSRPQCQANQSRLVRCSLRPPSGT